MLNSLVSRAAVKARSRANTVKRQRNNLRDEVSELKRKLSEVEDERDALRKLNAEILSALKNLLSKLWNMSTDDWQDAWQESSMPFKEFKDAHELIKKVYPEFELALYLSSPVK